MGLRLVGWVASEAGVDMQFHWADLITSWSKDWTKLVDYHDHFVRPELAPSASATRMYQPGSFPVQTPFINSSTLQGTGHYQGRRD